MCRVITLKFMIVLKIVFLCCRNIYITTTSKQILYLTVFSAKVSMSPSFPEYKNIGPDPLRSHQVSFMR